MLFVKEKCDFTGVQLAGGGGGILPCPFLKTEKIVPCFCQNSAKIVPKVSSICAYIG